MGVGPYGTSGLLYGITGLYGHDYHDYRRSGGPKKLVKGGPSYSTRNILFYTNIELRYAILYTFSSDTDYTTKHRGGFTGCVNIKGGFSLISLSISSYNRKKAAFGLGITRLIKIREKWNNDKGKTLYNYGLLWSGLRCVNVI
ncbi:hypothetical protein ACRALDRAFT_1070411 [Sodiomyces alcalophilus JCM 7366]|uniref:uncharacterized protein n=1 Tax=Sodiomyces alcalophilus JCM 7366 TaxID=591952 RepID=UPI0039B4E834